MTIEKRRKNKKDRIKAYSYNGLNAYPLPCLPLIKSTPREICDQFVAFQRIKQVSTPRPYEHQNRAAEWSQRRNTASLNVVTEALEMIIGMD